MIKQVVYATTKKSTKNGEKLADIHIVFTRIVFMN
jgi:hypothetical protein